MQRRKMFEFNFFRFFFYQLISLHKSGINITHIYNPGGTEQFLLVYDRQAYSFGIEKVAVV